MRNLLFILVVLTFSSLLGCGDSAPPAATTPKLAENAQTEPVPAAPAAPQSADQLRVTIIPSQPSAEECLEARVAGSGQSDFRWQVNGQELMEQTTSRLCEGFVRHDTVTVTVGDGKASGTASVEIVNAVPRLKEVSINPDGIARHADIVVSPVAFDADGDWVDLRYQWYINDEAVPQLTANTLPAASYARGDKVFFTIATSDGIVEGKLYQSATLTVPNAAPQITSHLPEQFETLEYSYQVEAFDPDGDPIVYSLQAAPEGMSIDSSSGLISWPLQGVKRGEYKVKIVVTDAQGAESFQEYSMTLGAK